MSSSRTLLADMSDLLPAAAQENDRLRRSMNDLVTLTALPAMWTGGDLGQIGNRLLDVLYAMLDVDFLFVRLTSPAGAPPIELARLSRLDEPSHPDRISEILKRTFGAVISDWPHVAKVKLGSVTFSTVQAQLGLDSAAGVLVAGSRHAQFPREEERLVLNIASNQVAMAASEARRLLEQKNLASVLDNRVAQRTAELAAANAALRMEIAERRQTEEELRRSAAFLAQGQRLTETGSMWWKLATQEIFWSDEMYRVTEYPKTQGPGVDLMLDRCHPEDLPLVRQRITQSAEEGAGIELEHRLLMPDGRVKYVHVVLQNMAPEGGTPEFVGAVTDITQRKIAEERLRRSEVLLAEGQRISLTGTFSWQVDTDAIIFSEELNRIFDFTPGTVVDFDRITERVYREDLPLLADKMADVRSGGDNPDYEIRLRVGDKLKHVKVVGRIIRHLDGTTECIGAVQDVTAQRLAEEARDKLRSELGQIARAMSLSTMAASIAHEVNQPLSGIITNASTSLRMLSATPPNIEGALETARRTIRDGNRAAEVIARLRILFKQGATTIEPVDLNDAAGEVIALLGHDLQRRRIALRADLAGELPLVGGDRIQLQQVIMNLLRNAMDAIGDIARQPRDIAVRTEVDGDGDVILIVEDSGCGIAAAEVERLFDAFHTTKADGMGIGLSVSRSIIEAHGGRIWAAPNAGPGASFGFSIPCQPADAGLEASEHETPGRGIAACRAEGP